MTTKSLKFMGSFIWLNNVSHCFLGGGVLLDPLLDLNNGHHSRRDSRRYTTIYASSLRKRHDPILKVLFCNKPSNKPPFWSLGP